jgi:hypothetical protein
MTDHYTAAHRLPHAPGSTRAWNRSTVVRKRPNSSHIAGDTVVDGLAT